MFPDTLNSITAVFCFALPILTVLFFRLYRHASLIALVAYYTLAILHGIGSDSRLTAPDFMNGMEMLFSFIQLPLLLLALLFFYPVKQRQQKLYLPIFFFIGYEIFVAALHGFTPLASMFIMIPGLLVITACSFFLFLRQLRFTLLHGKNAGLVLMLGALLFAGSCYLALFYAYFFSAAALPSVYAWQQFSASIAAVTMSAGLYLMRHRIRDLQELKVTRRELQMVFGN